MASSDQKQIHSNYRMEQSSPMILAAAVYLSTEMAGSRNQQSSKITEVNTVYLTGKLNGITFNVQISPISLREQDSKADDIQPAPGAAAFNKSHPMPADPEEIKPTRHTNLYFARRKKVKS